MIADQCQSTDVNGTMGMLSLHYLILKSSPGNVHGLNDTFRQGHCVDSVEESKHSYERGEEFFLHFS